MAGYSTPGLFVIAAKTKERRLNLMHVFRLTTFFCLQEVTWSALSVSERSGEQDIRGPSRRIALVLERITMIKRWFRNIRAN